MLRSKKSRGAVSTILLIVGAVLVVLIIVVFVIVQINAGRSNTAKNNTVPQGTPEPPKPVYETTVGDTKFIIQSATDLGSTLQSPDKRFQEDLATTEKFIKVVIGAQNARRRTNGLRVRVQQGDCDIGGSGSRICESVADIIITDRIDE